MAKVLKGKGKGKSKGKEINRKSSRFNKLGQQIIKMGGAEG